MNLSALTDDLAGQASVIDGDKLEIPGQCIRPWGIDATGGANIATRSELCAQPRSECRRQTFDL